MSIEESIQLIAKNTSQIIRENALLMQKVETLESIIAKKEDKLLTRIEAATLLKKTPKTFDEYRKQGRVVRGGGTEERPLFWESEVLKLKKPEF